MRPIIAALALAGIAGCSSVTLDQTVIDTESASVETQIVAACVYSGWFKIATGAALAAVPAGTLPMAVIDAGVDKVCADPAYFAGKAGTVLWLAKNLRDIIGQR